MHSAMCYSLAHRQEDWPDNFERVTHLSSSKRVKAFIAVIAESFCGTTATAPEGTFDWWLGHEHRSGDMFGPLVSPPSKLRRNFFEWMIGFIAHRNMDFGGCFAVIDPATDNVVAAFIARPPGDYLLDPDAEDVLRKKIVEVCACALACSSCNNRGK